MKRNPNKTLLIICEGVNTEPLFFNSILEEIKIGTYAIDPIEITIKPEPRIVEIVETKKYESFKIERKKQVLRKAISVEPFEPKGPPPLKWVLNGQDELKDGTYNEVWVVFDHDNHPARKEAFEKAGEEIGGRKVNIAFSSMAFEYYLLLNFEQIYFPFNRTECRTTGKNKKSIECGSNQNSLDCQGKECINGYASSKGYWNNSKGVTSLFPLIKTRLQTGFENSVWLRAQSNVRETGIEIYNRNPYVNSDELIKRLTGNSWTWLNIGESYNFRQIEISLDAAQMKLVNNSNVTEIIPAAAFTKVYSNGKRKTFGDRMLLYPGDTFVIDLLTEKSYEHLYSIFYFENKNLMFSI
ncbi:RloB family protein [Ferruginibacter paludis]|uniref:RloB family protein n=1 Tax=Ferruginibacter paludis TaxID=1310417 RepID=UPI0025B4CF75|nr:RloB family protein [Ferruginibacter paludis]MDN3655412.1 RloB family protein [Ferruginibacter paludis]